MKWLYHSHSHHIANGAIFRRRFTFVCFYYCCCWFLSFFPMHGKHAITLMALLRYMNQSKQVSHIDKKNTSHTPNEPNRTKPNRTESNAAQYTQRKVKEFRWKDTCEISFNRCLLWFYRLCRYVIMLVVVYACDCLCSFDRTFLRSFLVCVCVLCVKTVMQRERKKT